MKYLTNFIIVAVAFVSSVQCALFDKWPKECEGQQICFIKPKQFPQPSKEMIEKELKSEIKPKEVIRIARQTAAKSLNDEEHIETCEAISTQDKLYMVRSNTTEDWKMVVQNEDIVQTIHFTHCVKDKSECSFQSYLPDMLKSRCVTKYGTQSLVAYDPKTKTIDKNFLVSHPVACACEIFSKQTA